MVNLILRVLFLDYELIMVFFMLFVFNDCLIDDAQIKLGFRFTFLSFSSYGYNFPTS